MPQNTITIALDGSVTIEPFAVAVQHFSLLVRGLEAALGTSSPIEWVIDELHAGSATATIRGESEQMDEVEAVTRAYLNVGRALERREPVPYQGLVEQEAKAITGILNGSISSVRFETAEGETTIVSPAIPINQAPLTVLEPYGAYGVVIGRIQTLTNRKGLKFTIYDLLHDKAVSCYLSPGQEELMRDLWGKMAIVHGWVSRDPLSGRPTAVRRITSVEPLPEPNRYSYRSARGAARRDPDQPLPEDAVRRIRDG